MEREDVLGILEEKVHDVFNMCQKQLEIPTGDIAPDLQLMLDDKIDQLGTLIWSILQYQLSLKEG